MGEYEFTKSLLSRAQVYADHSSTCEKVKVGSVIVTPQDYLIFGSNHGCGYKCTSKGCYRKRLYGDNSKNHRLPSDCMAIHSEVDAICKAAKIGKRLDNAAIVVTRYPCEACARAIVESGIKIVAYGRKEKISDITQKIFDSYNVTVQHIDDWNYADNNS